MQTVTTLTEAADRAVASGDPDAAADSFRSIIRTFDEVARNRPDPEPGDGESDYDALWKLAHRAIIFLGCQGASALATMADYDSDRFGPMLGVSDEGSATAAIRRGALAAPKGVALAGGTPLTLGITHDAERLGAIGEVAVGPDEYATIRLAARGRVLTSTNVGTRVNRRFYQVSPRVKVKKDDVEAAIKLLSAAFAPYVNTVSGRSRNVTVFVSFDARLPNENREALLIAMQAAMTAGTFCNPDKHYLGLYVNPGLGTDMPERILAVVELSAKAGLNTVAVDGLDDDRFPPDILADLLTAARDRNITLEPAFRVDPQTTARHVWTGLAVARSMGLELGKYGLVPLTFEEQNQVIARIQYWMKDWCAAPVYYIDYPLVCSDAVYREADLVAGIRRWLEMVARHRVKVVLIDTAKKDLGRGLLKNDPGDAKGYLTTDQIRDLTAFSRTLNVKVLWAGGVTVPQAYELARLGIFGLYVTTAAALLLKLTAKARRDPALLGTREPDEASVARVKLLIEAGFLVGHDHAELAADAESLLKALAAKSAKAVAKAEALQAALHVKMVVAWQARLSSTPGVSP